MADLPSNFWAGWIAILTVTSLAGLVWLLFSIYFSKSESDTEGKVIWDDTLKEGEYPAPIWWFWLILSLLVFSLIYLILYPGIGAFQGVLQWSQGGRIDDSYVRYLDEYDDIRTIMLSSSLEALQGNNAVMNSAQGIYNRNCVMCHGESARGISGFSPNLVDNEWQWGETDAHIEQSIRNGRGASMPGWSDSLNSDELIQLVQFIQNMGTQTISDDDPGKVIYGQLCFGCHGFDGSGNSNIGAPSLIDDIWLYGNSDAALSQTIMNGRSGRMPGFQDRLDDLQIKLLVAWLTK